MNSEHDAAAIISSVERLSGGALVDLPDGRQAAILPDGKKLHSIKPLMDAYRDRPERIKADAELLTAEAFADYMNRFRRPESAIFVDPKPTAPKMIGLVDYHGEGEDAAPSFCEHKASYSFPLSEPMRAWVNATNNGLMDQQTFASFLQDREHDIENPPLDWMQVDRSELDLVLDLLNLHDDKGFDDGADDREALAFEGEEDGEDRHIPRSALYKLRKIRFGSVQRLNSLSRGIEVAIGQKAAASYNPKTGERVVHFSEQHDTRDSAGRKVIVPDAFFIHVPVFDDGKRHLLPVRLYYRQKSGAPAWGVELIDAPRLVRSAVKVAVETVREATALPVFVGKP